jgi:linoleoyl-CoA desaturase|tara:strand:+ start:107 stop:1201 length:1095 start_codon:yes stop_codon:yes gene_type:complete
MSLPVIKFNLKDRPEFQKALRKRVNQYFKENDINKFGNIDMYIKSVFMLALYLVPMVLMLTQIVVGLLPIMAMWVFMGFGIAGIGLSIMHDANHGAYSQDQKVNNTMGFVLNLIGGYPANWRIQHNVLHHSFTNIEGFDEDIKKGALVRFSPLQPRFFMHRFQVIYAPIFYGILTLVWVIGKDLDQLVRYKKMGLLEGQKLTFWKAFFEITFHKIWYLAIFVGLPLYLIDLPVYQIILGFVLMHFIAGMILALIFQTAHVIEETAFFEPDETGSVENNFFIHQLRTTANYANGGRWFSWFVGGLNYQVEHHLFPTICHVHYHKISKIVKETAAEYGIPYHEHKTFYGALKSHFSLLYRLGVGKI